MSPLIFLPDFQSEWQWPRQLNPHTDEIRQESQEWAAKFGAFSPRAQKSFDKCNFSKSNQFFDNDAVPEVAVRILTQKQIS